MQLWQIIVIVVVLWLLAMVGIVMFMMGASKGRRAERLAQESQNRNRLQPAHREPRRDESDPSKDAN